MSKTLTSQLSYESDISRETQGFCFDGGWQSRHGALDNDFAQPEPVEISAFLGYVIVEKSGGKNHRQAIRGKP